MAILYDTYDKLMSSGWVIDTAEDDDDVPDEAVFTLVLKEGAPKEIQELFWSWKDTFEWERDHI